MHILNKNLEKKKRRQRPSLVLNSTLCYQNNLINDISCHSSVPRL